MNLLQAKVSILLLIPVLWACSGEDAPLPVPEGPPSGKAVPAPRGQAGPVRPAPLAAGAPSGEGVPAAEPERLPPGKNHGGGRLHLNPEGLDRLVPWAAFTWPAAKEGVQKKLRLTTRPAGTGTWPWITLEAWIPARKGLKEWEGRRIALNRVKYQDGPGLAPWPRDGECYLVIRKASREALQVDLHLEVLDLVRGARRTVTGVLTAVKAVPPGKG